MASVRGAGGRPAQLSLESIARAGETLGMRRLSMNAVAAALDVTPTALYRHVAGRWELEELVGERILDALVITDNDQDDVETHLRAFSAAMFTFVAAHPGIATYLGVLFPRGYAGRRLLADEVHALERRGYDADAAVILCGGVATLTIAQCASLERKNEVVGTDDEYPRAVSAVLDDIHDDPRLARAHQSLPDATDEEFVTLLLTASIRGLVAVAPPGRPVEEILADLRGTPLAGTHPSSSSETITSER